MKTNKRVNSTLFQPGIMKRVFIDLMFSSFLSVYAKGEQMDEKYLQSIIDMDNFI